MKNLFALILKVLSLLLFIAAAFGLQFGSFAFVAAGLACYVAAEILSTAVMPPM